MARKRLGQIDMFTKRVRAEQWRRSGSEFTLACMVADCLRRWVMPGWQWTHFPAGEARARGAGARLQRMGLQPGWPDLQLLSPVGRIAFLELKRAAGGRLSDDQIKFRDWCILRGVSWQLATDLREAMAALEALGAVRAGIRVEG